MKVVKKGESRYKPWVGKKVVCPKTGDTLEFEDVDILSVRMAPLERAPGQHYTQEYVQCPCGGKIVLENEQKGGYYLHHIPA